MKITGHDGFPPGPPPAETFSQTIKQRSSNVQEVVEVSSATQPRPAAPVPSPTDAPLDQRFRDVMAGVATPVTVISAMADEVPHATTVSAFASLSMAPPMVVVCLDRGSDLLAMVQTTGGFGVNVLGAEHAELALTFARKGGAAKFDQVEWSSDRGLPRLPGAAWLTCRATRFVDGGDHVIVLGAVETAEAHDARPLTYHRRVFGTHTALPERV
ncbi:flavin reductase family protein [Amycolatopsis thermoflava]